MTSDDTSRWGGRDLVESYPGPGVDLTVMYNDLDPNNHLNNVAIGRFFEHARVTANQGDGLWQALRPGRLIVARVAIDYLVEGRIGPVHVRTRLASLGRTSYRMEQAAWQPQPGGTASCLGLAEVTLVHLRDGRPAPLSDAFREAAAPLLSPSHLP